MKNDLKRLYSDIIKTHSEAPFHFKRRMEADHAVQAYNPICGDKFELFLDVNDGIITEFYFTGFGCAISKAATSILIKSLEGKNIDEALKVCDQFLGFINSALSLENSNVDFKAFSGVHDFPERKDCATLSWKEMKKFLETEIESVTG